MNTTDFNPVKRRVGRRRRLVVSSSPTPPVAAPVLVSAAFVIDDEVYLELMFDRPVSIDGIDLGAFALLRHPSGEMYVALGSALADPTTVTLGLSVEGSTELGEDVVMQAGAGNGIVAVDGGLAWAGVPDLVLPFGE